MSATYALTVIEEHARPGLTGFIDSVHAMISVVADEFDVPALELTVVLTSDITASIRAHSEIERDFVPERSGGIVKGKTISVVRDFSETVIVLDTGDAAAQEELDRTPSPGRARVRTRPHWSAPCSCRYPAAQDDPSQDAGGGGGNLGVRGRRRVPV